MAGPPELTLRGSDATRPPTRTPTSAATTGPNEVVGGVTVVGLSDGQKAVGVVAHAPARASIKRNNVFATCGYG